MLLVVALPAGHKDKASLEDSGTSLNYGVIVMVFGSLMQAEQATPVRAGLPCTHLASAGTCKYLSLLFES